jgi:hypothetical protein
LVPGHTHLMWRWGARHWRPAVTQTPRMGPHEAAPARRKVAQAHLHAPRTARNQQWLIPLLALMQAHGSLQQLRSVCLLFCTGGLQQQRQAAAPAGRG